MPFIIFQIGENGNSSGRCSATEIKNAINVGTVEVREHGNSLALGAIWRILVSLLL